MRSYVWTFIEHDGCPFKKRLGHRWHPTPVLLPGKSHGQRSLVGYSPWGCTESDTTERLHFHFSLSCTGEGSDNPLQCSCLENPGDGGGWWAAVYGVLQSRTQLKQLSSSSSRNLTRAKEERVTDRGNCVGKDMEFEICDRCKEHKQSNVAAS